MAVYEYDQWGRNENENLKFLDIDGTFTAVRTLSFGYDRSDYQPVKVNSDGNLQVDVVSGGTSGKQYEEGDTAATATGTLSMFKSLTTANAIVSLQGHELANSNALAVEIVDGSGDQITAFGGGVQYATGVQFAEGNTGTIALGVRNDLDTTLVTDDNDYAPFQVDSSGRLKTAFTGSVGGVNIENAIDETAFDLNAAAFSETSNITEDYILDNIKLNFSTAESKTITLTGEDGTVLYEDTNTNQSVSITEMEIGFNANENFTVDVTQFGSAGTMDCIGVIKKANAALVGTPDVRTFGYNGTNWHEVRLDTTTRTMQTIDYAHHEIHSGSHYVMRTYDTIAKNGTKEYLIITPDSTAYGHVVTGFNLSTSTTIVEWYEDVTTSADGVLSNSRNRRRDAGDNNTLLIYDDPTVTGGATTANLLQTGIFGAGKNSFGGGARDNEEIILLPNKKYLVRFIEQNVSAVDVNFYCDWYEHTDKVT